MFFKKCYKRVTSEQVKKMMNENASFLLLDVREKDEYRSGHIQNSKNIPVRSLGIMSDRLPKDKNTPIITYCLSGARAKTGCKMLNHLGYTNIFCLGGIGAWPYGVVRKK